MLQGTGEGSAGQAQSSPGRTASLNRGKGKINLIYGAKASKRTAQHTGKCLPSTGRAVGMYTSYT